jgi:hypothetical protein
MITLKFIDTTVIPGDIADLHFGQAPTIVKLANDLRSLHTHITANYDWPYSESVIVAPQQSTAEIVSLLTECLDMWRRCPTLDLTLYARAETKPSDNSLLDGVVSFAPYQQILMLVDYVFILTDKGWSTYRPGRFIVTK